VCLGLPDCLINSKLRWTRSGLGQEKDRVFESMSGDKRGSPKAVLAGKLQKGEHKSEKGKRKKYQTLRQVGLAWPLVDKIRRTGLDTRGGQVRGMFSPKSRGGEPRIKRLGGENEQVCSILHVASGRGKKEGSSESWRESFLSLPSIYNLAVNPAAQGERQGDVGEVSE